MKPRIISWIILLFVISTIAYMLIPKGEILLLATTTSTYDSGLLDYIIPDFEEQNDMEVQIIAVGTGQAIANGERKDVDVILVHAEAAELKFVYEGFGFNRQCVMYNDFVILGPKDDPAGISDLSLDKALIAISENGEFISRGDDSGTHKKELPLWPDEVEFGDWYKETGQGMGATLQITNEKQAYTLADRGTYLSQKDNLDLIPLVEGEEILLNPYGVIQVTNATNEETASEFVEWIMSEKTQNKIKLFRKNGEILFKPLRGVCS